MHWKGSDKRNFTVKIAFKALLSSWEKTDAEIIQHLVRSMP
jgi:hypothetical protein